jgi:hypothetical protein
MEFRDVAYCDDNLLGPIPIQIGDSRSTAYPRVGIAATGFASMEVRTGIMRPEHSPVVGADSVDPAVICAYNSRLLLAVAIQVG